MIKSITAINYIGETLVLELTCPEKSGFAVLDVTGLGPSKASINVTELSSSNGSLFNSARVEGRNIVLSLKLLSNPTIELMRHKSYKHFPLTKKVKLIIETDTRICETYGYVESNEPVIWSQSEGTQISIICPDPNLYAVGSSTTSFSGIEPMFEFPFSNESLTEDLLIMGDIITVPEKTIYYEGDSQVGVTIYMHAIGPATNITIHNSETRELMKINTDLLTILTGSGIIAGDDIIVSTVKGIKFVKLLRAGVYINILNCVNKDANWFQLSKGDNVFLFTSESGLINLQFQIENQTIYEGV